MNCIKVDIKNNTVQKKIIDAPKIEDPSQVIIKVIYSGICGTDLHIIHGQFEAVDGVTLGHEFIGTVYEISNECTSFVKGDRVAVNPNESCRTCLQCRRGSPNLCYSGGLKTTLGIGRDGGWSEYCKVNISALYKIPDSLTFEQAVLSEPISCIIHGLDKIGNINIGSVILIIGAGIIGTLWTCLLHFLGHRRVYISELEASRRQIVNALGLEVTCKSWEDIQNLIPVGSVDLCIDCSGNVNAMQAALPFLRCGATFAIFGVAAPDKSINIIPHDIFRKELTIVGNVINTPQSFEKAIAIMESMGSKYLDIKKLNVATFPLDHIQDAFDAFNSRKYSKIVLKI